MVEEKKQTALIIEDNEDNMVLISTFLENAGYLFFWAQNGEQGVSMVAENRPDFVILDIQLPDILGNEVLNRIRALDSSISNVPVIAMTSYAMSGDREKLLAAGCDGYIEKPIDPMRVISQIKEILLETS